MSRTTPSAASAARRSTLHSRPCARRRRPSAGSSPSSSPTWSGFTPLSESRDAEEVRELLSRYFDVCRRIVTLYGGTVEKFIGDAVMAVWGTPTATEDDAERAVRAALDLVAAVSALGQEIGAEELRARAGILTGEAAVTLGAEGQGMVAGDLVNTASRVQSVAQPGAVYVGEATRRATEQTIVYEAAGSFELKGKEGLMPLWVARRVVSGLRGSLKSHGLEAPFVGRDRELRQIKDLFHTAADERKAHLLSITGIAGIGKSRLAWEFYKYFDGIAESIYWHRGRCLPYGEGVTYWALADMVRMRCRIAEDEGAETGLEKLRTTLSEHILDAEERKFVEPRLGHLLGFVDFEARDRQDLFAAWRIFFERLAETYPTLLAFEDMQWADESLLDFVEHLLDWSRSHPLFVVTLARPELLERRTTWGAGQRNFTSMFLEPLAPPAMEELLRGLVPGLADELRTRILDRAEGVPLYAVETVRMLLDRGLLVQEGSSYRLTGTIEELAVPETLQALIAARLDGLTAEERRLLQDGAVLGKTFTRPGLAALAGIPDEVLESLLASLVRKEVLGVQADPRSPEHGQYGFLQDLVRHVAYETLSKRDRKARHLEAARVVDDIEVVAAHYVAAYEAAPDADDASEIRAKARDALVNAGRHARSLAAAFEARRYFEQAAALAESETQRAELLSDAGEMAAFAGDPDAGAPLLEQALEIFEAVGDSHAAARVSMRIGKAQMFRVQREEALARLERAFDVISTDEPDEDLSLLASALSRGYWYGGEIDRAADRAELALDIAESHLYPRALVHALLAKSAVATSRGHEHEPTALFKYALELSLEHDLFDEAARCYFLLSDRAFRADRYRDALVYLDESLALARRVGNRPYEWAVLAERTYPLFMLGEWNEVIATRNEFTQDQIDAGGVVISLLQSALGVYCQRGELDEARQLLSQFARLEHSSDMQDRSTHLCALAALRRSEGRHEEALAAGLANLEVVPTLGLRDQGVKQAIVDALEAALALGDVARSDQLFAFVDAMPPGRRPPYLEAHVQRLRSRLARDAAGFDVAALRFRELESSFSLAVTLFDKAETVGDDEARAEATEIFERLGAKEPVLA
jgi:class 3 adenylate cyclase/tetratricopeptide (TPR) repeat protein